jgi:hypothetical protein
MAKSMMLPHYYKASINFLKSSTTINFRGKTQILEILLISSFSASQKPPVYDPYDPASVKPSPYEFPDIDGSVYKIRELVELINSSENILFPLKSVSQYLTGKLATQNISIFKFL